MGELVLWGRNILKKAEEYILRKRKETVLEKNGEPITKKFIDTTFVTDERICDGFYFASSLKIMNDIFRNPDQLDSPPEKIIKDIR